MLPSRWMTAILSSLLLVAGWTRSEAGPLTTMVNNGPSSNRVDIVFLGDGYTAVDLETSYVAHINSMLTHMFDEGEHPYPRYSSFFNVHRINTVSSQRGADVPPQRIVRDTALNARYYFDGATDRLLYIDDAKADTALAAGLSGAGFGADIRFVTVNDTIYGGGGGRYSVYAGSNHLATEIALHELGHSFNQLADEYGGSNITYSGPEPSEVNVTRDATGAKWAHWLGYSEPSFGVMGVYEGARYFDRGLFRPSPNSKMRALGQPFDAVSREKIILDIYGLVDPLDLWLDNSTVLTDPDYLAVDVIDPAVVSVNWFVNGDLVPGAIEERFRLRDFGFGPGSYEVTARAFDATEWVRINRGELEQSITWSVVQSVAVPGPYGLALFGTSSLFLFGYAWWCRKHGV